MGKKSEEITNLDDKCPLCGSERVNKLAIDEYWCKSCNKFFMQGKEIKYSEDGDIIMGGEVKSNREIRRKFNKTIIKPIKMPSALRKDRKLLSPVGVKRAFKRYREPRGHMNMRNIIINLREKTGITCNVIEDIYYDKVKTITDDNLERLANELGVDKEKLIVPVIKDINFIDTLKELLNYYSKETLAATIKVTPSEIDEFIGGKKPTKSQKGKLIHILSVERVIQEEIA